MYWNGGKSFKNFCNVSVILKSKITFKTLTLKWCNTILKRKALVNALRNMTCFGGGGGMDKVVWPWVVWALCAGLETRVSITWALLRCAVDASRWTSGLCFSLEIKAWTGEFTYIRQWYLEDRFQINNSSCWIKCPGSSHLFQKQSIKTASTPQKKKEMKNWREGNILVYVLTVLISFFWSTNCSPYSRCLRSLKIHSGQINDLKGE